MAQQRAGAVGLHPHINREVLVGEVDVSFGSGSLYSILQFQCRLVIYGGSVQHTSHAEVCVLCQFTVEDGLIPEHAQLVASREDAVGGLWLSEGFRTAHILHHQYLIAHIGHLTGVVGACRDGAELIRAVGEHGTVSHVVVQVDDAVSRQYFLNLRILDGLFVHHILAGIVPGVLAHALILHGDIFQSLIVRIVACHCQWQHTLG